MIVRSNEKGRLQISSFSTIFHHPGKIPADFPKHYNRIQNNDGDCANSHSASVVPATVSKLYSILQSKVLEVLVVHNHAHDLKLTRSQFSSAKMNSKKRK